VAAVIEPNRPMLTIRYAAAPTPLRDSVLYRPPKISSSTAGIRTLKMMTRLLRSMRMVSTRR
jgi:hypothetical protein